MKDRKQRKINQKKSEKIEQVVKEESQITTPSIAKNDNLWWEQPGYLKTLTDSVDHDLVYFPNKPDCSVSLAAFTKPVDSIYGQLRISEEGHVFKPNGDFITSSPNDLGLIDPLHPLIKPKVDMFVIGNNSGINSTLTMQNSPWLGEMGLGIF